jgi:phenylpropionate dioxygenase-like ring-hydroxylating dioxygenase large terminal subunit
MTDTTVERPRRFGVPDHLTEGLLTHVRQDTTQLVDSVVQLPAGWYHDPAIARLERTRIFGAVPFIAAFWSEVAEPGAYVAKQLPNNRVIIVRGQDGRVRSFVNLCRHRGATVKELGSGSCRAFSCPYHGWTYGLDGALQLVSAADTFGTVDPSELGLIELPTEERFGFIWVIEDPAATIDVATWLGPDTDAHFAAYAMHDMVCYRVGVFSEAVNWKVMQDAFLDGYHIPFVHTRSANRVVRSNTYVMEDFGRHVRFCSPRRSFEQWRTADPEPGTPMEEHLMLTHYVGPNCTLLQLRNNFQSLHFFPVGDDPNRCVMEMRLIVPRQQDSGLDAAAWETVWEKNWHILQDVLVQEDFPVLRGIQAAHSSAVTSPTLLGRNEIVNQAFHREVRRLIGL